MAARHGSPSCPKATGAVVSPVGFCPGALAPAEHSDRRALVAAPFSRAFPLVDVDANVVHGWLASSLSAPLTAGCSSNSAIPVTVSAIELRIEPLPWVLSTASASAHASLVNCCVGSPPKVVSDQREHQGPQGQGVIDTGSRIERGQGPWDAEAERAGARIRCHRAAAHRGHGREVRAGTTTSWPRASRQRATHSRAVEASIRIRAWGREPSTVAKRSGPVRMRRSMSSPPSPRI